VLASSVEMQQLFRGVALLFQFRCHTAFLKISHYGMQHLDVVWGRSLVVTSLS
jgi:hypothetical protein